MEQYNFKTKSDKLFFIVYFFEIKGKRDRQVELLHFCFHGRKNHRNAMKYKKNKLYFIKEENVNRALRPVFCTSFFLKDLRRSNYQKNLPVLF